MIHLCMLLCTVVSARRPTARRRRRLPFVYSLARMFASLLESQLDAVPGTLFFISKIEVQDCCSLFSSNFEAELFLLCS